MLKELGFFCLSTTSSSSSLFQRTPQLHFSLRAFRQPPSPAPHHRRPRPPPPAAAPSSPLLIPLAVTTIRRRTPPSSPLPDLVSLFSLANRRGRRPEPAAAVENRNQTAAGGLLRPSVRKPPSRLPLPSSLWQTLAVAENRNQTAAHPSRRLPVWFETSETAAAGLLRPSVRKPPSPPDDALSFSPGPTAAGDREPPATAALYLPVQKPPSPGPAAAGFHHRTTCRCHCSHLIPSHRSRFLFVKLKTQTKLDS